MQEPKRIVEKKLRAKAAAEQGVALLMVLICLAIIMPFTASFNMEARVDWQSEVNAGDEVKARNVHRGATRLSLLLFELQRLVFNQKQFRDYMGTMDITQVAPYLMSVFGSEDGAEGLGALAGLDTSALSELSLGADSSFEVRLEAESGKINLNCIAQSSDGKGDTPRSRTVETLEALIEPTLYDPLFDEEKADGERYNRQQVLSAIVDWIDEDTRLFDLARLVQGGGPEPYRYMELNDPYVSRNARMDSLQELHLVEGVRGTPASHPPADAVPVHLAGPAQDEGHGQAGCAALRIEVALAGPPQPTLYGVAPTPGPGWAGIAGPEREPAPRIGGGGNEHQGVDGHVGSLEGQGRIGAERVEQLGGVQLIEGALEEELGGAQADLVRGVEGVLGQGAHLVEHPMDGGDELEAGRGGRGRGRGVGGEAELVHGASGGTQGI